MIIFLYGEDTFRARQKLNEIIEGYQKIHKSGLNLKYLDCNNLNFEEEKNQIQTSSMFEEKKLIVFKNVFATSETKEKFLEFIKKNKNREDLFIIYEEKEINKNTPLFQFLKKYGQSQEFKPLEGEKLKEWLRKELTKFKTEIEPKALELLIVYLGNDLWALSNEIKKLVNFKSRERIKPEDVELLVKPKIETDIFKTVDAIAQKNKKTAISLIHKHLEKGDNPLYLLSMINFQFRNLLIIKDLIEKNRPYYAILKQSRLHPFIVKKSWQQAKKFTLPELKKIYQKIFQVDLSIKTGKLEPTVALDLLLTEIA
jgi:DNA polymerase-3 subunit delta